jgi:hypothetical protein
MHSPEVGNRPAAYMLEAEEEEEEEEEEFSTAVNS